MPTVNLENTLWCAGIVAEIVVLGLLYYRRAWRNFPVFCIYMAWGLCSDAGNFLVHHFFMDRYLTVYMVETATDSALQFGILVELTMSVFRPIRKSLSPAFLAIVILTILALGAILWPFSGVEALQQLSVEWRVLVRLQHTASILRILLFLLIAGFSQLLSIGWRDRELQIATGLGIYSIVSVAVGALQTHYALGPQFRQLNRFAVIAYLASLVYWAVSFATQEARRREFTPEIQNALLTMASAARATRVALHDSAGTAKKMSR